MCPGCVLAVRFCLGRVSFVPWWYLGCVFIVSLTVSRLYLGGIQVVSWLCLGCVLVVCGVLVVHCLRLGGISVASCNILVVSR